MSDVLWFVDVTLEVSCSHPGCRSHGVFAQTTRKECRDSAKADGWRIWGKTARCPHHAPVTALGGRRNK